jgi:hypothetical protein
MVRYSGTFGKNQEKTTGEYQSWLSVVLPRPASRHSAYRQLIFQEAFMS